MIAKLIATLLSRWRQRLLGGVCHSSRLFELDVVTIEANLIDGNRIVGNPAFLGLAGPDIERSGVPWAGDDVAVQLTFH